MDLSAVPYLINRRHCETGYGEQEFFIASCLVDPLIVGIGLTRNEALNKMIAELEEKHGENWVEPKSDGGILGS